jgi:hypothetical protein
MFSEIIICYNLNLNIISLKNHNKLWDWEKLSRLNKIFRSLDLRSLFRVYVVKKTFSKKYSCIVKLIKLNGKPTIVEHHICLVNWGLALPYKIIFSEWAIYLVIIEDAHRGGRGYETAPPPSRQTSSTPPPWIFNSCASMLVIKILTYLVKI